MGNIEIVDITILFFICSFLGFSFEYIYFIFKDRLLKIKEPHLTFGFLPLSFPYGIGGLIIFLLSRFLTISEIELNPMIALLIIAVLLGSTEYISSFISETIFKIRIWDYSDLKFNIHGRTSPLHMFIFGSLGTLFYYLGLEKLINLIYYIPDYYKFAMITILIFVNIIQVVMIRKEPVISFYVTTQKERESFKKK